MSAENKLKFAHKAWQCLNGMFAVYKPAGLSTFQARHIIRTVLLEELNALKQRPQRTLVKFLPDGADQHLIPTKPGALQAVEVPRYADHPLVRGPAYKNISLAIASRGLDKKACGVMVFAVRDGTKLVSQYQDARLPRRYTVRGRFGVATDTHDADGKIWQHTTYDHITLETLDRITSRMEGSQRRELIRSSGVDIMSQEGYELARRGLLHPVGQTNPLLTQITCTAFDPPEFELEITSYAESAQYLRKLVHDIGQQLKSSAIALQVRRTQDGPFGLDHALLKKHWRLEHIAVAIEESKPFVKRSELVPLSEGREAVRVMQEVNQQWNQIHQD